MICAANLGWGACRMGEWGGACSSCAAPTGSQAAFARQSAAWRRTFSPINLSRALLRKLDPSNSFPQQTAAGLTVNSEILSAKPRAKKKPPPEQGLDKGETQKGSCCAKRAAYARHSPIQQSRGSLLVRQRKPEIFRGRRESWRTCRISGVGVFFPPPPCSADFLA